MYVVSMFAYPSGDLHMGHAEAYAIGDAIARYWRLRGHEVLHPIGWDSFGLPAENAAIKRGLHPATWTRQNIETQAESFRRYGVSVDWRTRLHTSDPSYYRWTQWLFLRFFERGLAYRARAAVNWCPADRTVLANEQVIDGRCERCGNVATSRSLTQWFFKITAYADRLRTDMDQLAAGWPPHILTMQRNWIAGLHDWLISRQRYWGCPIPIIHCASCGLVPVPDDQLPVELPPDAIPLAGATAWMAVDCPACGRPAARETDTLDTFVDSSWYFLRYPNVSYPDGPFDPALVRPVDHYVGGSEHAVSHLLYARFFTKALHDMGLLDFAEPFRALTTQGHVLLDGAAMSKSKGNLVTLGSQMDEHGPDAVRVAMLFAGPPSANVDWADVSPRGAKRFLSRALSLTARVTDDAPPAGASPAGASPTGASPAGASPAGAGSLRETSRRLLREITRLVEAGRLNVALARTMELVNAARAAPPGDPALRGAVEATAIVLSLYAPYTAEEMWRRLGHAPSVALARWPG